MKPSPFTLFVLIVIFGLPGAAWLGVMLGAPETVPSHAPTFVPSAGLGEAHKTVPAGHTGASTVVRRTATPKHTHTVKPTSKPTARITSPAPVKTSVSNSPSAVPTITQAQPSATATTADPGATDGDPAATTS